MNHKAKWITFAMLLVGFAIAVQWSMSDEDNATEKLKVFQNPSPDELDLPNAIEEVENREDIDQFYEDQIQGYKKAKDLNIIQFPDQSFDIPEHEGTLTIDELWYTQHQVFMYYSVDLKVFEDKEYTPSGPFFDISRVNIAKEGDLPTQTRPIFNNNSNYSHYKIYEGKLYGLAHLDRLEQEGLEHYSIQNDQDASLNEAAPTTFRLEMEDGFHKTEEQPISYTYEPGQEILHTEEFHQTYKKDGLTVTPKKIEFGIMGNKITFDIKHKDYPITNLGGTLHMDDQSFSLSHIWKPDENSQTFESRVPPASDIPESLELDLDTVTMVHDEEYSLEIDVSDYDKTVEEDDRATILIEEKIDEHLNTDIILEEKIYDTSMTSQFRFSFEPKETNEPFYLSSQPAHFGSSINHEDDFIVTIDGEKLNPQPGMGYDGQNSVLDVNSHYLKGSEKLRLHFKKSPISQKIDFSEEIKID
ncbi:hypothetical protein GCM10010954_36280 [Halobacillus andaensis]|uniref:Uncharacterized protein n=1 Tax=Halobacillus andaensis TaxID=1176239 RepID=A0A917BBV8_HALAA|nr:hypothetical protein [Halobacillus andaensis]MBP2006281.1 hypothetical protein [Halobacillus andaensis]GGF33969.1 hypothetical protein GCM10010954_36280 [Halobacillus andaensis]